MLLLHAIAEFAADHLWAIFAAAFSLTGAALFTYAREQISAGTVWTLGPITRALPWNAVRSRQTGDGAPSPRLHSEFTLVDIFICDPAGAKAIYRKISRYRALTELSFFQEGVTAEGQVTDFATMRGSIARTTTEHGFYVSTISLGEPLKQGHRLLNIYRAILRSCFTKDREHWSQEIAFPTETLMVQIHFPFERPPTSFTCEMMHGTETAPAPAPAHFVDLFGNKSIVWNIDGPKLGDIFKITWSW